MDRNHHYLNYVSIYPCPLANVFLPMVFQIETFCLTTLYSILQLTYTTNTPHLTSTIVNDSQHEIMPPTISIRSQPETTSSTPKSTNPRHSQTMNHHSRCGWLDPITRYLHFLESTCFNNMLISAVSLSGRDCRSIRWA